MGIETSAARDFVQRTDEILNWNPATSLRVHDKGLGLTCFVRPLRRGIGGVIRYQWHDFRVTERRLSDGSLAELTDMDSIPRGAPQRFLSAVLYKVGRDTFEIVAKIARHLGIAKERIGFAGLKDRAAVTMQEISIDAVSPGGISPKRVLSLNRDLVRAAIGNLRWTGRALHFGEHGGNHFCLVIRQVEAEALVIKKAVSSLKRRGFINYFGHQRFGLGGGSGLSAVAVGKALVMGHYRQAATFIMSDDDACSPEEAAAKRVWRERGGGVAAAQEALRLLPRQCGDERAFLEASLQSCGRRRGASESSPHSRSHRGMVTHTDARAECGGGSGVEPDEVRRAKKREAKERRREKRAMLESDTLSAEDFRAGCDAMPHRYIYMQSFWSLLWNRMVSLWVRGHGLRHVKEGDLVLVATSRRAADSHKKLDDIHVVTAAEARRGVFRLQDLVLPLPGPGVEMQWPRDEQLKSQLEGVLQGAGVAALVRHRRKVRGGGFAPARPCVFRHVLCRPRHLRYRVLPDHAAPSTPAGAGACEKDALAPGSRALLGATNASASIAVQSSDSIVVAASGDAPWVSVELNMTLPAGSFATMAMRELTKTSMHPSRHFLQRKVLAVECGAGRWHLDLRPRNASAARESLRQDPQAFVARAVEQAVQSLGLPS